MSKILFTVTPAAGHMNPMIPIALALQQRGHEVRFITGLAKVNLLDQIGLPAIPILRGRADTPEQISHPVGADRDTVNPIKIFHEIRYFLKLIEDGVHEMEAISAIWPPDLVVTDFSTPIGVALAKRNGLRWVTSCTVPSCIRTLTGTPVFLGGLSRPRHWRHHLRDWGGRQLHEALRLGLTLSLRSYWRRLKIDLNLPNGGDGLYSPDAILALAPCELEFPRRDWPRQLHWVGPIDWSEAADLDEESQEFLTNEGRRTTCQVGETSTISRMYRSELSSDNPQPDRSRSHSGRKAPSNPLVFITFGSEQFPAKERLLRSLCQTLAGMNLRTIVTGGGAVDLGDLRLPNLHVIRYAPYKTVLPLVDVVIHHGGSGITYATLQAGKPALIIPDGKDQPDNAQKVVEVGAGLRLSQRAASPAAVKIALERLLNETHFSQAAQRIAQSMEHYTPVSSAVAVIEGLL